MMFGNDDIKQRLMHLLHRSIAAFLLCSMSAATFAMQTEGTGFGTVNAVSHLHLIQAGVPGPDVKRK